MSITKEKAVEVLQLIFAQVYDYDIRSTERELHSKFLQLTGDIIDFERYGYKTLKSFLVAHKLENTLLPRIMLSPDFQKLRHQSHQNEDTDSSTSDYDSINSFDTQYETRVHKTNKTGDADDELMVNLNQSFEHCFISKAVHFKQTHLKMPWNKKFWKLKVTHLQSATSVWARLVNDDDDGSDDDTDGNWADKDSSVSICF